MYAVTGITGQVGGAVATRLLEAGQAVRAIVRNEARGGPWAERGCAVALAEMTDADALAAAFEGAEAAFIVIPPMFDPAPGFPEVRAVIAALTEALARARPARVVCLSTIGAQAAEPNLLSQLGLVERALGGLSMPVAFLRAAWFMENAAGDLAAEYDAALGPEPLDPELSAGDFHKIVSGSNQAIKKVIMDQKRIVGVGNIYANEALFAAGVDPSKPASRLSPLASRLLFEHIRRILRRAIASQGTTFRDYRTGTGESGNFQLELLVYGREGEPCRVCGTWLSHTHDIDGRITVFCHKCQR